MCPARLILLPVGSAENLVGARVAMVYASPAAGESAEQVANRLAVQLAVVPELQEKPGESRSDAVRRSGEALSGIADLHRGETVVLIAPGLILALELGAVLGSDLGAGPVELEHDGYGWTAVPSPASNPNAVTLATYERAAERFRASIPTAANGQLVDLFDRTHLQPGATVLELGSGTGRDALELEARGYRVRRTDAAASFVEMMQADGQQADRLNALTDEFSGPYDLVFGDAVFLHFDRDQLTTVLRKAAGAAGLLAFTLREGDGDEWTYRHLDLPRHVTRWQEPALRRLLTTCGWTTLSVVRSQTPVGGWLYVLAERTVQMV
jgi:SAM-dependent methyltransferase